jgi:hypothetical protein
MLAPCVDPYGAIRTTRRYGTSGSAAAAVQDSP